MVDTCEDQYLLKASKRLKENPAVFWKWRDQKWSGAIQEDNGELEEYMV